jgi:hypothetical protein
MITQAAFDWEILALASAVIGLAVILVLVIVVAVYFY